MRAESSFSAPEQWSRRILLNSKTREHPNGLANTSGVLGHYLMDSVKSGFVSGCLPLLRGSAITNDDGAGGGHIHIPRHTNLPGMRKVAALRGWQFQPNSGSRIFPEYADHVEGFGSHSKRLREQNRGWFHGWIWRSLPNFNNFCEMIQRSQDRYRFRS